MLFCDDSLDIALASQAASPLFAKLSPELRNQIYEYVFTTDEATHKDLETAKSRRPWSDLLLTCQRIFAESNGIYRVARTAYWRESTFYVDRLGKNMLIWLSAQQVVDTLHDQELALVQKVIISCDHRNDLREWHLTARGDSMQCWIATTRFADEAKAFSLVGKRTGLYRVIHVLS